MQTMAASWPASSSPVSAAFRFPAPSPPLACEIARHFPAANRQRPCPGVRAGDRRVAADGRSAPQYWQARQTAEWQGRAESLEALLSTDRLGAGWEIGQQIDP